MAELFDGLYGNEQLKTYISAKISDGMLPHALIIEGPQGSGKTTVALMTAASLAPDFADKVKKLATPDVTLHEPTDGKKSIAKISINGKTLTIFLALKPSLFPQSKYHHRDVSDISKYAKTPFMMKMRSDRSVKYVKELISVYMQLNDISKNNRKMEDHFLPYETTQALVRKKLIKKL